MANSGLPYPIRCVADGSKCRQIELPGVPLGSFGTTTYEEVVVPAEAGDVFVFCSDGIFETFSTSGEELGAERVEAVVHTHREAPAKVIVERIFETMAAFRGDAPQTDDQTAVVVKILA
jgi:serine phosphatase RsbU (regulator of sigma subunit)